MQVNSIEAAALAAIPSPAEEAKNPLLVTLGERVRDLRARRGLTRKAVAQASEVSERHRHRYEVNNAYRDKIAESGLRFSGTSPDGHLVEFVEYPRDVHPYLVGTQAHPELKSRPTRPHPLFSAFIAAAIAYKAEERLPLENLQRSNGSEHALQEPVSRG